MVTAEKQENHSIYDCMTKHFYFTVCIVKLICLHLNGRENQSIDLDWYLWQAKWTIRRKNSLLTLNMLEIEVISLCTFIQSNQALYIVLIGKLQIFIMISTNLIIENGRWNSPFKKFSVNLHEGHWEHFNDIKLHISYLKTVIILFPALVMHIGTKCQ